MKQIISYETCDGKLFSAKEEAEHYERALNRVKQRDDADIYWVSLDHKQVTEWVRGPGMAERP